jgi:hypothetical protein
MQKQLHDRIAEVADRGAEIASLNAKITDITSEIVYKDLENQVCSCTCTPGVDSCKLGHCAILYTYMRAYAIALQGNIARLQVELNFAGWKAQLRRERRQTRTIARHLWRRKLCRTLAHWRLSMSPHVHLLRKHARSMGVSNHIILVPERGQCSLDCDRSIHPLCLPVRPCLTHSLV